MLAALAALSLFAACKNDNKANVPSIDNPTTTVTSNYVPLTPEGADTFLITSGTVRWEGRKVIGDDAHVGEIKVASGLITFKSNQVVSGDIQLDMASLSDTDLQDPGQKAKLEQHLKSGDFFEVEKFPKASFIFSEVIPADEVKEKYAASGALTIKGQSKDMTVSFQHTLSGNELKIAVNPFSIDRNDWGVNFRNGISGVAKDLIISDQVSLIISLTAQKK